MKNLHLFLFLLFISFQFFSQETENLPKAPWQDIVEMKTHSQEFLRKWNSNIDIKLTGNFTKVDSINIEKIIAELNSRTETISIKISNSEDANYKIFFSDIYKKTDVRFNYKIDRTNDNGFKEQPISSLEMLVHKKSKNTDNETLFSILKLFITKSLVTGYLPYSNTNKHLVFKQHFNKKKKYFRLSGRNLEIYNQELKIIEEVYKKGFDKKLNKAKKQYENSIKQKIKTKKILNRSNNLWWVRNPIAVIILPILLLVVLSIYLLEKIKIFLSRRIKKHRLQLVILTVIALFFADIIIITSVSAIDFLTIPINHTKSLVRKDTIITTILLSLLSIPVLLLIYYIESKIKQTANSIVLKTSFIFISTGFLPFIFVCLLFLIRLNELSNKQGAYTTLSYIFLVLMILATIRALISYFYFKERQLVIDNELKLSALRELKTKAELKSLQAQINPHFLYNSLNSIASLAPIDAIKTQKMAHSLSDLFKYSINRKNENVGTIKDEIKMVKNYLEIEKIRFGDRLQFTIMVDTSIENHKIPLFLIQPLVENAVKHGISKNVKEGQIDINIEKKNTKLYISVSDNGPNFPEGLLSGHGLQTVYDLLHLNYKDNTSLNWTNTPQKKIFITIPDTL